MKVLSLLLDNCLSYFIEWNSFQKPKTGYFVLFNEYQIFKWNLFKIFFYKMKSELLKSVQTIYITLFEVIFRIDFLFSVFNLLWSFVNKWTISMIVIVTFISKYSQWTYLSIYIKSNLCVTRADQIRQDHNIQYDIQFKKMKIQVVLGR